MKKETFIIGIIGVLFMIQPISAQTWTTKRLTFNSGFSWYPVIAIDSNNHLHVVWTNFIVSNWEVYYKKGT